MNGLVSTARSYGLLVAIISMSAVAIGGCATAPSKLPDDASLRVPRDLPDRFLVGE